MTNQIILKEQLKMSCPVLILSHEHLCFSSRNKIIFIQSIKKYNINLYKLQEWISFVSVSVSWGHKLQNRTGKRDKLFKTDKHKRGRLASNHTFIPLSKVDIFCFHATNSASKCLLLRPCVYEPGLSVIEQFYSMASCNTIICVVS